MPPNTGKGYPITAVATSISSAVTGKQYTWEEVSKHNSAESAWIYIGNKVYDITPWLDKHPGGTEMLLLAAGRDCTDLFRMYHPFTDKPRQIMDKFVIGTITKGEFPQYVEDTGFYKELCQRTGDYFRQTKQDPRSPWPGLARLVGIFTVAYFSFMVTYDSNHSWWMRLLAAQIFGICQALPLLHCMHDASHTSIGWNYRWWSIIGRGCMDWFAGGSLTSWYNQHVIGHHVYTNVMGADPDLPMTEEGDIRRITRFQKWTGFYQFQHIYLLFLYSLLAFKSRVQDVVGVLTAMNGPIRVNLIGYSEHIYQVMSKLFWASWRILLPLAFWKTPLLEFIPLFLISEFATGYYLTLNFQVSHISPEAAFLDVSKPTFSDEWAVAQVKTTVDYAHNSWWMAFLCGALNYQTEHHLFPGVSQYHYPAIAPIVRDVCKKYGHPYIYVPSMWEALKLHVVYLKQMGVKEYH